MEDGHLRIGELSRRAGVSVEVLRAWERRYGLLEPSRSAGGFRLYGEGDERRVRLMSAHLARGLSAAEAARLALAEARSAPSWGTLPGHEDAQRLRQALDGYDEGAAQAALDRLLAAFTPEAVIRDVIVPYLHELGERWERGEATVGQEHFASNLLRGRLLGLARGWDAGGGPRAILACAPGEHHDLPLIAFGIALRRRGWRITFLGSDTPVETVEHSARLLEPDLVVVSATVPSHLEGARRELGRLARKTPLRLAGAGATQALAKRLRAGLLEGDPVGAAEGVAERHP